MSKTYFFRANTCEGLVNRAMCNLYGIDKVYVTKGLSQHVKSVFAGRVAAHLKEQGIDCEYVFSPFSMKHYDGIIARGKGFAVIDECCFSENKNMSAIPVELDCCVSGEALTKRGGFDIIKV